MESRQADFKLKQTEQQTILDTISAYFDFIFKTKNEEFNLSNVNLFERQVESDSARLQKGEITLTDLAQSESSLAGANAANHASKSKFMGSSAISSMLTEAHHLHDSIYIYKIDSQFLGLYFSKYYVLIEVLIR